MSWFDDKTDHEVIIIISFLIQLYNLSTVLLSFLRVNDVRPAIESLFHVNEMLSKIHLENINN